ncbi:MAG: site-specific DNA-methyltransferase [Thiobacillus sp.]
MPDIQPDTLASLMLQTPDLAAERLTELRRLFPDLFDGEGKLKSDELRQLAGEAVHNREHYEFIWNGKRHAKANAYRPATATLTYDEIRSVNPEKSGGNLIIEGENLESLKCLLAAYRESVKCIYIDPPYNTGKDFVYSDDYSDTRRAYWEDSGQMENGVKLDTNPETAGRYHSNWLSMMYPRLLLARQLLRDDGVVFVSIDDHEVHNLRRLMDEVYGEENFIASLVWEKGRKNDAKLFSVGHEYMLVYAHNLAKLKEKKTVWRESKPGAKEIIEKWRELKTQHGESNFEAQQAELRDWYRGLPDTHPSKKLSRHKWVDKYGPWRDRDISWPGGGGPRYDVPHPTTKKPCKVPERGWIYSTYEEMQRQIKLGFVVFRDDHTEPPFRKAHLIPIPDELDEELVPESEDDDVSDDEIGLQVIGSVIYKQSQVAVKHLRKLLSGKLFENPKDHEVIGRLIKYTGTQEKDDLILDFFGGSGTSAQAVLDLNAQDGGQRKFILVQIPEQTPENSEARKAGYRKISDLTIERVKRVIKGYGDDPKPLDAGFKVFRLTPSHFPRADFAPDPDKTEAENVTALKAYIAEKEKQLTGLFTPADIIDEVLLKNRFKLHYALTDAPEFTANKVWRAVDGERSTLLCLDLKLQPETVGALLKTPQAFICLERALDTADKWNLRNHLGHLFTAF